MGLREEECICGGRSGTMRCRLFIGMFSVSFFFVSLLDGTPSILFFFTDMEEPIFGRPPKVDVYKEVREQKKYIS
jgi:hypothetical protein